MSTPVPPPVGNGPVNAPNESEKNTAPQLPIKEALDGHKKTADESRWHETKASIKDNKLYKLGGSIKDAVSNKLNKVMDRFLGKRFENNESSMAEARYEASLASAQNEPLNHNLMFAVLDAESELALANEDTDLSRVLQNLQSFSDIPKDQQSALTDLIGKVQEHVNAYEKRKNVGSETKTDSNASAEIDDKPSLDENEIDVETPSSDSEPVTIDDANVKTASRSSGPVIAAFKRVIKEFETEPDKFSREDLYDMQAYARNQLERLKESNIEGKELLEEVVNEYLLKSEPLLDKARLDFLMEMLTDGVNRLNKAIKKDNPIMMGFVYRHDIPRYKKEIKEMETNLEEKLKKPNITDYERKYLGEALEKVRNLKVNEKQ